EGLYGESGIRTHGTLTSTHAFQACTFGHSVISPWCDRRALKKNSRREGDSNPRSRKRLNGFRDRPIRPLSHLSQNRTPCPRGFEPPAFGSAIQCSIQLSYGRLKPLSARSHPGASDHPCLPPRPP